MKTIKVRPSLGSDTFKSAPPGAVFHLFVHGMKYSAELRANPPRVRIIESLRAGFVECELIDEWPDAPEYWPPDSAPPPAKTAAPSPAANQGRKSA
jgi:hypothetical protein